MVTNNHAEGKAMKFFISMIATLMSFSSLIGQYQPLIDSVQVNKNKITIIPSASFKNKFLIEDVVTFEYDQNVDLSPLDVSILTIPFIGMAAPAVWISGMMCEVEVIDQDLYNSLKKIKEVIKTFYPTIAWEGDIVPKKIVANKPHNYFKKNDMALMFSGGVDSVASSIGRFYRKQLLITNHGTDKKFVDKKTWSQVKTRCEEFAKIYGHTNTYIKFNYRYAFNLPEVRGYLKGTQCTWFAHVTHGLYLMCPTSPLLYLMGYDTLYIASSSTRDWPYPWGSHPLIDNNMKFCGIQVCHDQDALGRAQKIGLIADIAKKNGIAKPKLRVCWHDDKGDNCLKCEKCLRTIHAILSQGEDPKEYGLFISLSSLKKRTIAFLTLKNFDHSALREWKDTQYECRTLLNKKSLDKHANVIAYLEWFSSLDLLKYCDKKKIYLEDEKKKFFFQTVWDEGCALNSDPFSRVA